VEIVRRVYEAFNEGQIEAVMGFCAEDLEFHEPREQPDSKRREREKFRVQALPWELACGRPVL